MLHRVCRQAPRNTESTHFFRAASTSAAALAPVESRLPQLFVDKLQDEHAGVVVLTLARHERKNALGLELVDALRGAVSDLHFDTEARVVILRSAVDNVFCAGGDLKERLLMNNSEVDETVCGLRNAFNEVAELPMPTIAAIEGYTLGTGLQLAMACDFRIAGEKAILGSIETSRGILPGGGGSQRLLRLVGPCKAKELIFTSRKLSAKEAEKIGLVNYAVPENQAYERALELAHEILPNGPIGVRMAKEAITKGMNTDLATGIAIERMCYAQVIPTKDRIEALRAFKEKRDAVFKGE